ncbi:hypothetical protein K504DRAFT_485102 [Pleomassaria siparia CBS 279.74]|uniref:Transcriptional regulatory protein RXT2 N-terminal domain-containing protein n=1 Tax=Pleomassaria siparia CBS 279.74 TaxID=1314801 RepID=A0A6G1JVI3_9PLEO|nr:hypothetical protein K504DRAFT_485102 [Pleomassaria siparia CBS 279.74]
MAGSQQQQIIDTIFNMKRRLLRPDDSSDSEDNEPPQGLRRQNLKRKAQYARGGRPETSLDPPPFKKRIEHAGYQRYILQRNPPRYDPDGDVVEPGDEYEDEDDLSTVEDNPYADIRLENLLAPLTSAADLPTHPSYSIAFTSKHLTNLTNQAGTVSRKEKVSLCRAKDLFSKFSGDLMYVPSGLRDNNSKEHHLESVANGSYPHAATNGAFHHGPPLEILAAAIPETQGTPDTQEVDMQDLERRNGVPPPHEDHGPASTSNGNGEPTTNGEINGASHDVTSVESHLNGGAPPSPPGDDISDTASQLTAHRMTTRARAQAASTPSPTPSPSSIINPIHPLFTFSTDSLPHRDFGLPAAEAEDTRMLLMAFVSKQEEISRAATDLYMGMLQGERMRQDVLKWSKAEAHAGEMSDGEDWYDRDEWGLEQDLAKGKDEDEEETTVTGKKSTRQRRKPDKEDR